MGTNQSYTQGVDNKYITRVRLGDDFTDQIAVVKYMLNDELIIAETVGQLIEALPEYAVKAKRRDSTVGGNDAVNSYYQFCENDDVVHPINTISHTTGDGMGRIYNEIFDEQQQIVWLSFGIPDFANAADFLKNSYDTNLAKLMNTGDASGIAGMLGKFLGEVVGTVIMLPFYPLKWTLDIIQKIVGSDSQPTKYYDFKPTMALYYKQVNVILAHLAVNMNLAFTEDAGATEQSVPELFKRHGLDILNILSRKYMYDKHGSTFGGFSRYPNTNDAFKNFAKDVDYEKTAWGKIKEGWTIGETEALMHFGFKVEKSSGGSTESAHNTTKESEVAGLINAQVRRGRNHYFNFAALKNTPVGQGVDALYQAVSGIVTGLADSVGVTGGVEALKGAGYIDIPEIYESSSFQKNYSFDFQLRTPYGDPLSIFYSLYIPLAMLIAGAFPRSVGQNAYTSPFLVKAYCKGMFAIPMGIIDSITIKRGASEYGWNKDMLPTQIDISFTIKDLSPVTHVALADGGISDWLKIFGQNSSFQEYMLTLSGADVAQRVLFSQKVKAKERIMAKIVSNNKYNALMFGFSLANIRLGRLLSAIEPISKLPGAIPKPQG